jgi:uncharacterized membrane protein HdeD (DUF308 family)
MTFPDRPLLLLGDWHWLVRDPLDVLRLTFFGGTIAFALMGRSTAVGLTAASVLLLVARIVNLPRRFDLGVVVAMTFIAWGTALSLYGQYHFYDTIVHGTTPIFYAPVLYVCLVRLDVLTDPGDATTTLQHAGVFVSTLAIGMAVGAGYEVIEWLSDSLVGTAFVENADDTGRDLLADTIGSLVGAGGLTVWSISGWTSRRVTYRAVPPPDVRRGARAIRALVSAVRARTADGSRAATGPALAAAGLATLAFGVLVLAWPEPTVGTLVRMFGIYSVTHGGLKLLIALIQRRHAVGVSLGADALVTLGSGIAVLAWPRVSAALLFYAIALTIVLAGLVGVAAASVLPLDVRERSLLGAAAVTSVVIGVVMLAWPRDTVLTLRWLVAAQALVVGPLLVAAAIRLRRRSQDTAPPVTAPAGDRRP